MPISKDTVSLIQQAGQTLYSANQTIVESLKSHKEYLFNLPATAYLTPDGETGFKQLQDIASLASDLHELEEELKAIYARATVLASPQTKVMAALPGRGRAKPSLAIGYTQAQDVVVKDAEALAKTPRRARPKKVYTRANLSKNGKKVVTFLESVLSKDAYMALTLQAIANGAGIASGSVTESLSKVIATGAVVVGEKGMYKLP